MARPYTRVGVWAATANRTGVDRSFDHAMRATDRDDPAGAYGAAGSADPGLDPAARPAPPFVPMGARGLQSGLLRRASRFPSLAA